MKHTTTEGLDAKVVRLYAIDARRGAIADERYHAMYGTHHNIEKIRSLDTEDDALHAEFMQICADIDKAAA